MPIFANSKNANIDETLNKTVKTPLQSTVWITACGECFQQSTNIPTTVQNYVELVTCDIIQNLSKITIGGKG